MSKQLDETQDRYTPDTGTEVGPVYCGVCGDEMDLEVVACTGPRGFVQAMGRAAGYKPNVDDPFDIYVCKNSSELWHKQVVALRNEAQKTSSTKMERLLREEADEVLRNRVHTKVVSKYFW